MMCVWASTADTIGTGFVERMVLHAMFLPFGFRHGLWTLHCLDTVGIVPLWAWLPYLHMVVINNIVDLIEHSAVPGKE